jgi:hypothetical protein
MAQQGLLSLVLASCLLLVPPVAASGVPQPVIEKARGGTCVAEPSFMRRNHMDLLKHQRDDTMRAGVRGGKFSLRECIDCHASQTSNSVIAQDENFCQSCHQFAAVKLDCFECHSSKPHPGGTGHTSVTTKSGAQRP